MEFTDKYIEGCRYLAEEFVDMVPEGDDWWCVLPDGRFTAIVFYNKDDNEVTVDSGNDHETYRYDSLIFVPPLYLIMLWLAAFGDFSILPPRKAGVHRKEERTEWIVFMLGKGRTGRGSFIHEAILDALLGEYGYADYLSMPER